ncbi:12518_t:CDS:2 [Cetraspora pellucida]|uniref:12518_t:CDS:1 n=1 Tax=Cetraspora pellucida TaxID=1433469 RepID=A0ACA9K689_9GLOM|nr:12518_t:CDS:2 [Cetraspora pellucida]
MDFKTEEPIARALYDEILQTAFLRVISNNSQKRSRLQLITEHENRLKFFDHAYNENLFVVYNTYEQKYKKPTPKIKFTIENKVSIKDLRVNEENYGKFLVCRVITKCIKINALLTIVEDPEGDVERLALYNLNLKSSAQVKGPMKPLSVDQASKYLPIGTQIIIRNPSYQISGDGNPIICSDNPDDVIIIVDSNVQLPDAAWATDRPKERYNNVENKESVDEFRCRGNDYFMLNDFISAIREYSGGIKLEPHHTALLANRAEAYLRLQQFKKALNDVEMVLKLEPGHLKAAFRKGKALCGLKRYQEANIVLRDLYKRIRNFNDRGDNFSIKQSVVELLKHVEMLSDESQNGKYNYIRIIDELHEKSKIKENKINKIGNTWIHQEGPRLDLADYLNDDIEICISEGKGRGWFAKHDIPEHTLLMASKPFEIAYYDEAPDHTRSIISKLVPPGCIIDKSVVTGIELMIRIAQKLLVEPEHCREFYQLYCGPNLEPIEKLNEEMLCCVDINRIMKIFAYVSFEQIDRTNNTKRGNSGMGIWVKQSYFNHTCVDANVYWLFFGNLMIIRTLRPILKGEELVICHYDLTLPYERRARYLKSMDIECQCRLCMLDMSEGQEIKIRRDKLINDFKILLANPFKVKELASIVSELRNIRKEHLELDPQSLEPSANLAFAYVNQGDFSNSLPIRKEIYKYSRGAVLDCTSVVFGISFDYCKLGKRKQAKLWFDKILKEFAEYIRGKFKDDEIYWRRESLNLLERFRPNDFLCAKRLNLADFFLNFYVASHLDQNWRNHKSRTNRTSQLRDAILLKQVSLYLKPVPTCFCFELNICPILSIHLFRIYENSYNSIYSSIRKIYINKYG